MATLAASPKLNTAKVIIPNEWLSWLVGIKKVPYCYTFNLKTDKDLTRKVTPVNISKEDIARLKQLLSVINSMKDAKYGMQEEILQVEETTDEDTEAEDTEEEREDEKQDKDKKEKEEKKEHSVTPTREKLGISEPKKINSTEEKDFQNENTIEKGPEPKISEEARMNPQSTTGREAVSTTKIEKALKQVKHTKLPKELKLRLNFFKETVDILYYPDVESISTLVIPDPMLGIRSVRLIINHKSTLKPNQFEEKERLFKKGLIQFSQFKNTCLEERYVLPAEMTWNILIRMGIACPLERDEDNFATLCFIPCLIGDDTQTGFKEKADEIVRSPASLCVRYIFNKNTAASHGAYFKILKNFTECFPWKSGWELKLCYSQKVELRQLGMVGGVYGVLHWTNPEDTAMDPEEYEFMLLEHETTYPDLDEAKSNRSTCHALHRDIQVHLMSPGGKQSKSMINILQKLDERFTQGLPECPIYLACKKCPMESNLGFPLENGFRPKNRETCRSLVSNKPEHKIDYDFLMLWLKPFNLNDFLKSGIKSIEKWPFHRVKKDIKIGDQIWIYRDSTSNKWNPIASNNPYAHVVVVVSVGEVIEVVHVVKNSRFWKGFCMGTIKKVPIEEVPIGDEDLGNYSCIL